MTVPPCRHISLVKIATMSLRKFYLYILRLVHKAAIITSLYTVLIIAASPPRESSLHTFARSYYYCSCSRIRIRIRIRISSYISSPPLHPSHTTIESADYNILKCRGDPRPGVSLRMFRPRRPPSSWKWIRKVRQCLGRRHCKDLRPQRCWLSWNCKFCLGKFDGRWWCETAMHRV